MPVVEADVETVEVLLAARRDFRDEGLRRDSALLRGDHDRGAVHVVRTDEMHPVAGHSLMTNPNVGLDVFHDVPDVESAVGVGQCGGDEKIAL